MAAAAHDVGRAEHDEITGFGGLARGFLVDRKFRDVDALRRISDRTPPPRLRDLDLSLGDVELL